MIPEFWKNRFFRKGGSQKRKVLTVRDSRFLPLVMKVKPCVSMATPVRWMCSSTYLQGHSKMKPFFLVYKYIWLWANVEGATVNGELQIQYLFTVSWMDLTCK